MQGERRMVPRGTGVHDTLPAHTTCGQVRSRPETGTHAVGRRQRACALCAGDTQAPASLLCTQREGKEIQRLTGKAEV